MVLAVPVNVTMKQEADFSIRLRHYLKAYPLPVSCPIEVKDSRGKDYIAFSEVKEEQCNNAMASKSSKGNLIRIMSGTVGGPDYAWFIDAPAYIVIKFIKQFSIIDAETFILERDRSKRKSLTSTRAADISIRTIKL